MKSIRIGIASQEQIRQRTLDIAAGRLKPKASDPKIWFTSMKSVGELLNEDNRALLRLIRESQPNSLTELSELTGRETSNLSRTLSRMKKYGLLELEKTDRRTKPIVKAEKFLIEAV